MEHFLFIGILIAYHFKWYTADLDIVTQSCLSSTPWVQEGCTSYWIQVIYWLLSQFFKIVLSNFFYLFSADLIYLFYHYPKWNYNHKTNWKKSLIRTPTGIHLLIYQIFIKCLLYSWNMFGIKNLQWIKQILPFGISQFVEECPSKQAFKYPTVNCG